MPRIHNVDRCTTETLLKALNTATRAGCTVELIQWVGGRDWVVITYQDVPQPQDAR